ncbi:hypothetical protein GIB67_036179 [Kingdonia uniflora]|uniref:BHLH domain-containing protein n=1 Tax=Kingdonia uniflora TaxID=39325 RepID=A0A7J7N902_9MAGN|nr:hypothetical protein GIB67_036179 [Kingdonia uniflora]
MPRELCFSREVECVKLSNNGGGYFSSNNVVDSFNGYSTNTFTAPELFPELVYPLKDIGQVLPQVCFNGDVESEKRASNASGLSPQSVAARQRRRKITEKTQELGKLIPGGGRMNTAEMFQAASKYVKYLQAQIGILESIGAIQGSEDGHPKQPHDGLQVLLASPTIHEMLYSEEKCLIPKQCLEVLAKDRDIQTNPSISSDIDALVKSLS